MMLICIKIHLLAALFGVAFCEGAKPCEDTERTCILLLKKLLLEKDTVIAMMNVTIIEKDQQLSTLERALEIMRLQASRMMMNVTEKDNIITRLQRVRGRHDALVGFQKHLTEENKDLQLRAFFTSIVASVIIPLVVGLSLCPYRVWYHLFKKMNCHSDSKLKDEREFEATKFTMTSTCQSGSHGCVPPDTFSSTTQVPTLHQTKSPAEQREAHGSDENWTLVHVPILRRSVSNVATETEEETSLSSPRPQNVFDHSNGTDRPTPTGTSPSTSMETLNCSGEISLLENQQNDFVSKNEAENIMKNLVDANDESKDLEGLVFSKKNFATAIVGSKGAMLSFPDQSVSLYIPEGALTEEQPIMIHRPVNPEELHYQPFDKPFLAYTPIIHCAPEGTKFQRPVKLTFGHCAVFKGNQHRSLTVLRRPNEKGDWGEIKQDAVNVDSNMMTVEINGFSDYVGCTDKDVLKDSRLVSAVQRENGERKMYISIYSLMNIAGFVQDNAEALISRYSLEEMQEANVILDANKNIDLEGDSKVMSFSPERSAFKVNEDGFNSSHFVMSPIPSADNQHGTTDLIATVSVSQIKKMPLATVAISRTGHKIDVNDASSRQKTKLYPLPTQAGPVERQPHQTKVPPSGQHLAKCFGLGVTHGRPSMQGPENHKPAIQIVRPIVRNQELSDGAAEASGFATSADSGAEESKEQERSMSDGAQIDPSPP